MIVEQAGSASKKKRAGFFENNIYVKPLRSREEMKELEHDMPEDIKDVDVVAIGNTRIISPAGSAWDEWFENDTVSDDFMAARKQPEAQKREAFQC